MAKVRTRKRGKTFSYIFEAGKKDDGKRKVIEKGGYPTKQDAYNAGVSAYNDWKHGNIGITSENISVKDFLNSWLENVMALNVKPTSMQIYHSAAKRNILPYIGDIPIQKLTPAILDNWMRNLQKAGYSKNTLLSVHSLIHHALNYAVYPAELIASNPANYIKVPKKAPTNIVKRHIISRDKFNELLEKYPFGTDYYIPILLLFHTGMRLGEVCGLKWDNIDFDKKIITLDRQIVYISKKGYYLSTLKTESSNRYIVVDDFLIEQLRRWRNQQSKNEKSVGDSYVYTYCDNDTKILQQSKVLSGIDAERVKLVCVRRDGKIIPKDCLERILKKEGLNAHSFRHTHATILIENGAIPKGVAGRLGHTSTVITQNLYTHNTQKLQSDTAEIFISTMQTNSVGRQPADKV